MQQIAAILTDFGNKDAYAAVMKGVLLTINPDLRIVDISNEIDSFNILSASYILYTAFDYFPENTIFLVVVDPGVGSDRYEIVCETGNKFIIAPDNGVISMIKRFRTDIKVHKIDRDKLKKYYNSTISSTFHGRDIFSPVAALLSLYGINSIAGDVVLPVILNDVDVEIKNSKISANIINIDKFGNCISGIHRSDVMNLDLKNKIEIIEPCVIIKKISRFFSEKLPGETLAYWGSSDFLEIALRNGNASEKLNIKYKDCVILT